MVKFIVVYITTLTREEAQKIGRGLVEKKLAACVQITQSIQSIYVWEGKLCDEEEVLMIIKTREELFEKLADYVKSNHSYQVPQIVAVPIVKGSEDYLNWVNDSLN